MPAVEPVTTQTRVAESEIHRPLAYPAMTTILLARHGETDWNAERRLQGHADTPLNDYGRAQARALARGSSPASEIDAVYASDLRRAHETAGSSPRSSGSPVDVDPEPARDELSAPGKG